MNLKTALKALSYVVGAIFTLALLGLAIDHELGISELLLGLGIVAQSVLAIIYTSKT